jgi:hypothetical protein
MVELVEDGADRRKVLQRVYKYGGQPFVRDFLSKDYGKDFDRTFGPGNGKALLHATAGRFVLSRVARLSH